MSAEALAPADYEVVLRPNRAWIRLDLRELWEHRDLLMLLVRRELVSKYKQTLLGPAWFILQPLIMALVFAFVFGRVADMSTSGLPRILFYLCSLLGWSYFSQSLNNAAVTFTANADLFGKVYFPRLIVPIALILSNLFALALQFAVFVLFYAYHRLFTAAPLTLDWHLLLLPLLILQTALFSLGMGLWVGSLSARYRDLAHAMQFFILIWMFVTPVFFTLDEALTKLPASLSWIFYLNPMAPIVESYRILLLGVGSVSPALLGSSIVITFLLLVTGVFIFQKIERTVVDTV